MKRLQVYKMLNTHTENVGFPRNITKFSKFYQSYVRISAEDNFMR